MLIAATGVVFGIVLVTLQTNRQLTVRNYGNSKECKPVIGTGTYCTLSFNLREDIEPPVLIRYQLEHFIANEKEYIQSKSRKQLDGTPITLSEASRCNPYITN